MKVARTPVDQLLPAVLTELQRSGVRPDQVTVIPALGVHHAMSEASLAHRVGESIFSKLHWEFS